MQLSNTLIRSTDTPDMQGAWTAGGHPAMPQIDLNEHLVPNQQTTFYLKVHTNCMAGAGIHAGDMLVVDRSMPPTNGKVIIAQLDGELLVRYYERHQGRQRLLPAEPTLAPIEVDVAARFAVWGVVTYVIRKVN